MRRNAGKLSNLKMSKNLTLNTNFNQRQKRMLQVEIWDFKGEKDNPHRKAKV